MLRLKRQHLDAVVTHLQQCYPQEGCGLLIGAAEGDSRQVRRIQPIPNGRRAGAERRYLIAPEVIRRAEREAKPAGLDLIGFFHSHPDVAAVPSDFDREHAWPWYSYLILSVEAGRCREPRCWRLRDDRSGFDPEQLELHG